MALSSSAVGIRIVGRLEIFDIVFYLATIGAAQTDDSSHLAVLEPLINPHQRSIPIEFTGHGQRYAVFCLVGHILG